MNFENLKCGDKILCCKSFYCKKSRNILRKGEIYIIVSIGNFFQHNLGYVLVQLENDYTNIHLNKSKYNKYFNCRLEKIKKILCLK